MDIRYISAKLFLVLALICFVVGAALFRTGSPPDIFIFSSPLAMVLFPRLIPFALGVVSACFGLVYFVIEKSFRRHARVSLTLVQMAFLLVGVFGHIVIVRFWWRVLGEDHATHLPVPLWSVMLFNVSITISVIVLLLNIFLGKRTPIGKA
jgi:hypothetical protein